MAQDPKIPSGILEGWKEISEHLKVSVRTAQNYARDHGLPVYRLPGNKGRVWAKTSELDSWKPHASGISVETSAKSTLPCSVLSNSAASTETRAPAAARPRPRILGISLLGAMVLTFLVVIFFFYSWHGNHPGRPLSYRVSGRVLQTFGEKNESLWSFALPDVPQCTSMNAWPERNCGLFADVDNDGKVELLYPYEASSRPNASSTLYCFRADGSVAWTIRTGHDVTIANGSEILNLYFINCLGVLKQARPDGGRIIVASHHESSWTEQIAIFTGQGDLVAEYWHPGWIFAMAVADLDHDGAEEIVLGGVNDGYTTLGYGATLVVLDSCFTSGQGSVPEGDRHQILAMPHIQEAAVLLFPEFDIDPNPVDYCYVDTVKFANNHLEIRLTKGNHNNAIYAHLELDEHLKVVQVIPTSLLETQLMRSQESDSGSREKHESIQEILSRVKVLKNRLAGFPPQ